MTLTELIIKYVVYAIVALITFSTYIFLVGTLFPEMFLKLQYGDGAPTDRGLKKYKYPDGRAVLYEPHPIVRAYISRYILYVKDGAKYLRCSVRDGVGRIVYEAAVFNNRHKLIDVITVRESAPERGYTHSVMLPADASYVSLRVKEVNAEEVDGYAASYSYDRSGSIKFMIAAFAATVVEAIIVTIAAERAMSLLEQFTGLPLSVNVPLTAIGAILVGAGIIYLSTYRRRKKVMGR